MGPDPKQSKRARKLSEVVESTRRFVPPADARGVAMEGPETVSATVARALMPFLLRDDGWLRVTPQEDGETVYWKWKWTAGPHINHYVMAVYPASQSSDALSTLAGKVDAVDRGEQSPVKDHYFKGERR